MTDFTPTGWTARLSSRLVPRELTVRSPLGQRTVTLSPRQQLIALVVVAALTLAWCAAIAALAIGQVRANRELSLREARVAEARAEADQLARELLARQQFIEQVVDAHFADELGAEARDGAPLTKISAAVSGAGALAALETRQLTLTDKLAQLAEARSARAERAIRRVGLNPRLIIAKLDDRSAQGGPLLSAAARDPRFAKLGDALARMTSLERGLDTIPSHLPAGLEYISSGFGFRHDPFTGEGAMHAGLDFRGPTGTPIYAAADGTVTFAGDKGGYGNCIEITHANGLMTRYGHMSAFRARLGQKVAAGEPIGAIGSTGRSTGPHLHFEVRVNGAAVNPRPYLEARA